MKRTGLKGLSLLVTVLLLCTTLYLPAMAQTAKQPTWTVLLYLCGTDLESEDGAATDNLNEILSVAIPENIHMVIETGGTKKWKTDGISAKKLQRWQVTGDGLTLMDSQPLASMGDAQTLGSFLAWGTENYPADHYMTVLWDHGGGSATGVAFDEMYDYDSLTLSELAQGLSMAKVSFELIGFDACLMASLESAAVLSPYAHYMVASEETEPGGGWDYAAWLKALCDDPARDGLSLGTVICDSYMAKCKAQDEADMATLSVTDLSAVSDLLTKFDAMATEMTGVTKDIITYQTFVKDVKSTENYGGNNENEGYTNMVDLGDLAINTQNVLSATALNLLDSLFAVVKYNVKGASRSEANGLSVYYPLSADNNELTAYADTASTSGNYLRFIQAVAGSGWNVPQGAADNAPEVSNAVQAEDYSIALSTEITDDGYYALQINGDFDSVASVNFGVYYLDYDSNEYLLLGTDNDIVSDWDTGYFTDNFRGVWPTLNGNFCEPTLLADTDEYNLYSIPIELNGVKTSLRAAYVWDSEEDGHYEVYGAWNGIDSDTGMSSRDLVKLKDGDQITLLFDAVNWDTGETTTYEMGSFTVDGDVVMQEDDLTDGQYLYQYIVTDVFGRETYSDNVIMESKDGDITVYNTEDTAGE